MAKKPVIRNKVGTSYSTFTCRCGNTDNYRVDHSGVITVDRFTCRKCGAEYVHDVKEGWTLVEATTKVPQPRQVPDHLRNLNEALDHAKHRVEQEILVCPTWGREDKDEWQRKRVAVVRRLMLALSEYL